MPPALPNLNDAAKPADPPADSAPPKPVIAQIPEPVSEPKPKPPESTWSLKDAAQQRGINPAAYESDQALAEAMFSAIDDFQKNEPFVTIGQQFAPYADKLSEFQAWQAEQAKPAETTPTPEDAKFDWSAPEYDPRWEGMVERDERGYFKAPDGLPSLAPVAEKMNTYRQFQTDALTKFLGNPQDLIHAASADKFTEMEQRITEANQKVIEQAIQQQRNDAEMNAYVQKQEKEIYRHDEKGGMLYDNQGVPMLNPKGQAMAKYANMLETGGVTDPATIRQLLDICLQRDELSGRFQQTPQTPPQSSTPTQPPAPKKRFLDRIRRSNNRGGTIPDDTAPEGSQQQNPDATMQDITRRIAGEQGVTL